MTIRCFVIKPHLSIILLSFVLVSCGRYEHKTHKLHFVPYQNDHDFALETTTGTLCKTWQWERTPKQPIDGIPVCFMMGVYGK
jgi:hypothetical protein